MDWKLNGPLDCGIIAYHEQKKTALGMYVGCLWAVSEFTCSACTVLFIDRCYGEDIIPGTN